MKSIRGRASVLGVFYWGVDCVSCREQRGHRAALASAMGAIGMYPSFQDLARPLNVILCFFVVVLESTF